MKRGEKERMRKKIKEETESPYSGMLGYIQISEIAYWGYMNDW